MDTAARAARRLQSAQRVGALSRGMEWRAARVLARCWRRLEQQVVDHSLVLIRDVTELGWQCVEHMKVRHRQQLGLALGQPFLGGSALTLGAVPIAAAVVGDQRVRAVLAARDMAAECRRAAALDRRHHLQLLEADVPGIARTPRRPMIPQDVRDLQLRSRHTRALDEVDNTSIFKTGGFPRYPPSLPWG